MARLHYTAGVVLVALLLNLLSTAPVARASFFETEMSRMRKTAADSYLDRVRNLPNVSALPSGLLFSIERRGHGDVAPAAGDVCEVHYHIRYRWPGTFNNTRLAPYPVHRSPSQLPIAGMQEAMQYMREGDRWELVVPYTLAFGEEGLADRKLPSWVNFRVDLEVFKCPSTNGKTSSEIDAALKPLLKVPMPEKTERIRYEEL